MTEPNEVLKGLITPNTGDLVGTWGSAAINPDMTAIGGMLGGVVTKSLTNVNVTLTSPTVGSAITPGAGPTESQNAVLRFTGTLTGNCVITIPLPGFYIADNRCTVGSFYVQLTNGGGGDVIGIPPGVPMQVYSDGTNVRFVNLPNIGAFMDLAGVSAVPAWVGACTVPPWLLCDGSVYNIATYAFLGAQLAATFGGNGSTTFGVPDLRGRWRVALDSSGTNLTSATMSPNGNTLAATGGGQRQTIANGNLPASIPYTDPQHTHLVQEQSGGTGATPVASGHYFADINPGTTTGYSNTKNGTMAGDVVQNAATGITINAGGANTPLTTLPPTLITGITLIRSG